MRFVYKINSRFDGFSPKKIPERLKEGRLLRLGWERYLDDISVKDEVWVVFVGGTSFQHSVYVQGLVAKVDVADEAVWLRVSNYSTAVPLVDQATTQALLATVGVRYRQVFLWPEHQPLQVSCTAADCEVRTCKQCLVWRGIPQIEPKHYHPPTVLAGVTVVPSYWIVPARCFLYRDGRTPAPWVARATNMFTDFKIGEKRYAFPLAAGMHEALKSRGVPAPDAIVPIPLSPEKIEKGELNRTAALADELGALMSAPVQHHLSLSQPISKRRMELQGFTVAQFKERYREYLQLDQNLGQLKRILLLDDVITRGSTLSVAVAAIKKLKPDIEITIASAGQMILTAVVADANGPAW